mmetsp:Transcript_18171/g.26318  ORF Transcript_18171/g.26318 Transcript_18171/m.26318 type:complete len:135 (-) Transcript_18171:512-916(-)
MTPEAFHQLWLVWRVGRVSVHGEQMFSPPSSAILTESMSRRDGDIFFKLVDKPLLGFSTANSHRFSSPSSTEPTELIFLKISDNRLLRTSASFSWLRLGAGVIRLFALSPTTIRSPSSRLQPPRGHCFLSIDSI